MSAIEHTLAFVRHHSFAACLTLLLSSGACERVHNLVSSEARDAELADAEPDGERVGVSDAGLALCGNELCACADGEDNDGDGLIDGFDPECTGPYDQDEATFATGEDKEGNPLCNDCFFDGNPGFGDDGCRLAESCAIDGTTTLSTPACNTCDPTPECIANCLPRTPNGCDCFGCCEVHSGVSTLAIRLRDSCSLAVLDDESKCPRCQPSEQCLNPCERCELCAGKRLADLPDDCATAGEYGYTCDRGEVCGASSDCTGLAYCVQGCCVPVPF